MSIMIAEVIKRRHAISKAYCDKKGWDFNNLSIDQIFEIRKQQEWKDATIGLIN